MKLALLLLQSSGPPTWSWLRENAVRGRIEVIVPATCCTMVHPRDPNLLSTISNDSASLGRWVKVDRQLTSNKILVQIIHPLHIRLFDLDLANIRILHDPLLPHTLWQRHIAMLHAPPYHQLRRCALVLVRELHNRRILHLVGACQRCVRFNRNAVLLAVLGKLGASVEWVDLDLVDGGLDAWVRGEELVDLRSKRSAWSKIPTGTGKPS